MAVRPSAVAGSFYARDARQLNADVARLLQQATAAPGADIRALIVPHAGYVYSGVTAAHAYVQLSRPAAQFRRVVLLGPAHRVALRGMALPGVNAFATPLGQVEMDSEALHALSSLPQVCFNDEAHAAEHSLEVQLPFLQCVLGDFRLVPLVVGQASAEDVAQVIERYIDQPDTLIVVSSDLSHYHPYAQAQRIDHGSAQRILALSADLVHEQACGATPINGLLLAARRRALQPSLLDLRNSGDTAGDKARVVGYAAFAFSQAALPEHAGRTLTTAARNAIAHVFSTTTQAIAQESWLNCYRASFVTLTIDGTLRGCIGSLAAQRPLLQDVQHNAVAAAFRDHRFAPLTADEFSRMRIEVSLLDTPRTMTFENEADALRQLQPQVDGVLLEVDGRRATFLPQVWEKLPQPAQFLAQLKQKAGLAADFWSERIQLSRYSVRKFHEHE